MRGRKPKSAALHDLHGDPSKLGRKQLAIRRAGEFTPDSGPSVPPSAPAYLSGEMLQIWDAALAAAPEGLLQAIDAPLLGCLTTAVWLHARAVAGIDREGMLVPVSPKSSRLVPNPRLKLANQQAALILRLASELGFSPSARAKLGIRAAEQWYGRGGEIRIKCGFRW